MAHLTSVQSFSSLFFPVPEELMSRCHSWRQTNWMHTDLQHRPAHMWHHIGDKCWLTSTSCFPYTWEPFFPHSSLPPLLQWHQFPNPCETFSPPPSPPSAPPLPLLPRSLLPAQQKKVWSAVSKAVSNAERHKMESDESWISSDPWATDNP